MAARPEPAPKQKINLVAYSTPETSYAKLIPAFNKTSAGKGVTFTQSYGASGDQSRAVAAGQPADVVHFALEPDIARLVDAKLVSPNWDQGQYKGIVANTMVVFVVRKGNPKHITTWDDLVEARHPGDHAQPVHLGRRPLERHGGLRRRS